MLWTEKYKPTTWDQLAVHKKKKEDFQTIIMNGQCRLLLLQGQSGCGKNSMIDLFGEAFNW